MNKQHKRIKFYFLDFIVRTFLLLSLLILTNCKPETKINTSNRELISTVPNKEVNTDTSKTISTLNNVNFYLENSLSMNGYLEGENFRRNIRRFTRGNENYVIDSYFINLETVPENNMWEKVQEKNINTQYANSDTGFILEMAIKNLSDSTISAVVTEGIYSSKELKDIDILDVVIEENIKELLSKENFDTVIIKCISNFNGTYYIEAPSCSQKSIRLDQIRPYYIFIFGKPELINKFLKDGVSIEDLDGLQNELRFNNQKDIKSPYTILSKGDERKGRFRSASKKFGIVHEIIDAEAKSGSSSNEFQFSVAIDCSSLKSLNENYLLDKNNYNIKSKYPYEIVEVKPIDMISPKAQRELEKHKKARYNFTHFMVLRAQKEAISGEIHITLKKGLPDWITNIGIDSDCEITGNTEQTYTLDKTIKGLYKAYNYDITEGYFSIQLTIKI